LPDVFVEPEDGGDMFLRNVHWLSTRYKALCPRLFITTTTRTWNPTYLNFCLLQCRRDKEHKMCEHLCLSNDVYACWSSESSIKGKVKQGSRLWRDLNVRGEAFALDEKWCVQVLGAVRAHCCTRRKVSRAYSYRRG
jgi:hypothetical protein